jgi:nucleoside-diphosphate-sugar epimerase
MTAQPHLLIFGLGYTAERLAARLEARGWEISATTREGRGGTIIFADRDAVLATLRGATHILSSVPPSAGRDPVLDAYGEAVALSGAQWVGYLSSTGVYGNRDGRWVDEDSALAPSPRATPRATADCAWQALRGDVHVFRLAGIYGPGRSVFDRIREGTATRVDLPGQITNRIHVDDIVSAIIASFTAPPGVYNLADDDPGSQRALVEYGCRLLGVEPPPLIGIDDPSLSAMARSFLADSKRVANTRAKEVLGWTPDYPDYRSGLKAISAADSR